jgi:hypothetical protein
VPIPKIIKDDYLSLKEEDTKKDLIDAMVYAFEINERLINDKIVWVRWVMYLLLAQALILGVFTFVPFTF